MERAYVKVIGRGPSISLHTCGTAIQVEIYGDVYGGYLGGRSYDSTRLVEKIANLAGTSELTSVLSYAIGNFFVVCTSLDGGHVEIYTSPGGHGLFYCRSEATILVSSQDAALVAFCDRTKVNQMELFHIVSSGTPSPFQTPFKELQRLIGGCRLRISADLETSVQVFMDARKRSSDDGGSYDGFVRVLEGQLRIIANEAESRKQAIASLLSGGIDSSILTHALRKFEPEAVPITAMSSSYRDPAREKDLRNAEGLVRAAQWPWIVVEYDESSEQFLEWQRRSEQFLAHPPFGMRLACLDADVDGTRSPALLVSGDMADVVAGVWYTKGRPWFPHSVATLGKLLKESCHSCPYMQIVLRSNPLTKMLARAWERSIPEGVTSLPKNALEYLLGNVVSYTALPVLRTDAVPRFFRDFYLDFVDYKKETVLKPLLGDGAVTTAGLSKNDVDSRELSRILRRVSYAVWISVAHLSFDATSEVVGRNRLVTPASQGPMLQNFLDSPLALKDVLSRKRFSYRYFRRELKRSYYQTTTGKPNDETTARTGRPRADFFEFLTQKGHPYFEYLSTYLDEKDSAILDVAESQPLKSYVRSLYGDLRDRSVRPTLSSFLGLVRTRHLEGYLRSSSH